MVHRAPDSRLLTSLLSHEKDYTKHLLAIPPLSHSSLAAFSAYAAASPAPAAHALIAVAGALAGADDALQRYVEAVDEWRNYLKGLKELEDEVGNIIRDREILVTRLIKASKSQKPTRDSLLSTSHPSHHASSSTSSLSHLSLTSSSKLTSAQSELQACEAHLAAKERDLDVERARTVKEGLRVRCKAMVECGWAWGEMGKEGLRALEGMGAENGDARPSYDRPSSLIHKPLPLPQTDSNRPSSDLSSSLAPEHSASQINLPLPPSSLPLSSIPPAHAINDLALPHMLERRITEADEEEEDGSSAEEEQGELKVVENERFNASSSAVNAGGAGGLGKRFSIRRGHGRTDSADQGVAFPTSRSDVGPPGGHLDGGREGRERKGSFFGSLRGLFKHKEDKKERDVEWEKMFNGGVSAGGAAVEDEKDKKGKGKWATRTDKNLRKAEREGKKERKRRANAEEGPGPGESSSDEGGGATPVANGDAGAPAGAGVGKAGSKRLKKARAATAQRGYSSDGDVSPAKGTKKKKKDKEPISSSGLDNMPGPSSPSPSSPSSPSSPQFPSSSTAITKPSPDKGPEQANPGANLARNSSIISSASAPPALSKPPPSHARTTKAARRASTNSPVPGASSSRTPGPSRASSVNYGHGKGGGGYVGEAPASLMSIVEGVARQNREGWRPPPNANANASGLGRQLTLPKAPPPVKRHTLDLLPAASSPLRIELELPRAPPSSISSPPPPPQPPRAATISSAPSHSSVIKANGLVVPKPLVRPAKSPLRSALRNSSRSPSPVPVAAPRGREVSPVRKVEDVGPVLNGHARSRSGERGGDGEGEGNGNGGDDASISSYETGHEAFDVEDEGETEREDAPSPPPHDYPHAHQHHEHVHSDGTSASSASTETPAPAADPEPSRRKSVRVSLQPTFSSTPPAVDDDDDEGAHAPWSSRNGSAHKGKGVRGRRGGGEGEEEGEGVWQDSSDEDEEYRRAKRLLSRVARKAQAAKEGKKREGGAQAGAGKRKGKGNGTQRRG